MSDEPPELEDHPALADLHRVVELGLERGGGLLTRGERQVALRIGRLEGASGLLYARLTQRVPTVFALDRLTSPGVVDVGAAIRDLEALGLVDSLVTWPQRAAQLPRAELVAAARALGLPTAGRKAALVEQLGARWGWHSARWIRVRHQGLVHRLERFAQLRARPDRSTWVIARLGVVQWPAYPLTRGARLWPTRRALLAWESLLHPEITVDAALVGLSNGTARAPGRLDLRHRLTRAVREVAREHERTGDAAAATALYERLHVEGGVPLPSLAFRWSRAMQSAGHPGLALDVLHRARREAHGAQAIEIGRAGKRLARSQRSGWAPDRPLRTAPERHLRMPSAAAAEGRPRWHGGGPEPEVIEAATRTLLAEHGRRAVHGEGRLWRTLFALLFAEAYFEPVPGALPVPYLSGPLDLGTPAFRAARAPTIQHILAAIERGSAPALIEAAHTRWHGTQLAWARWDLADASTLAAVAEGIGPTALLAILEALLTEGRGAASGLPDLVVLPGRAVDLPRTVPRRLPQRLMLAEVKGPTDTLRDAQAVWIDRLLRADVPVEVWNVREVVRGCPVGTTGSCAV